MTVYKTDGLSNYQKFHRKVFQCPEGSLSHWGVKKIEYFYRNERTKLSPAFAHTMRRMIALVMPIFNLLDVLHYIPMAAYKCVKLQPKDALFDLLKCLKCLQVFFCAVPMVIVAVIEPKLFYRTDNMWLDVKSAQVKSKIAKSFEKLQSSEKNEKSTVENLETACVKAIDEMVNHKDAIAVLNKILAKVISEVPTDDPEKQEIIIEQYIEMFSELLVCSAHQQVELDKMTDHFIDILELIVKTRHPLLRMSLIHLIVTTAKNDPETYEEIAKKEYDNGNRQVLPYLVARLITDDENLLERVMETANNRYFRNRQTQTTLIAALHEIYECELSQEYQEKALGALLDCFELDVQITEASKPVRRKKGEPKDAVERDQMIADKRADIEGKTTKRNGCDPERQKRQIYKLNGQIKNLEKQIAHLEEMSFPDETEKQRLLKLKKESGSYFESAMDILHMLLSLNDEDLIKQSLDKIGSTKAYAYLSDEKIVTDVFKAVFDLQEIPAEAFARIQQLRAPWALVAYHGRLSETKHKFRADLIEGSKAIVQSLLNGTYAELRHETETNPTLKKVFETMPGIRDLWITPATTYSVKDLYPEASRRFAGFEIVEATDPSDILLIGNDTHTCVHLGGRIERVSGLSAFIRDGKIHTVLIKDDQGVTSAETQIQLMWDGKNEKPVLFVEQANFAGADSGDYSLENAIYNYAKERAKELGLDLVTCYKMKDPKGKLMSSTKYKGKVQSLGSSSPLEYVNRYFKNYSNPYDLGQTHLVAMA